MQLQIGEILDGKVTGVKKFGAFVQLPNGSTGMVHISEISNDYIQELSDFLHEGQQVKVKLIGISPEGKIALSIKKAVDTPPPRPQRADSGKVWQPKTAQNQGADMSFEDMMSRFKSQSEEKISDLKKATEGRRGGYSRKR